MKTAIQWTLALSVTTCAVTVHAQGPPGMMRMPPVMNALDSDGDGTISADEITEAPAALVSLDKDDSGTVTADELRPNFFGGGGPFGRGRGRGPEGRQEPGRGPGPGTRPPLPIIMALGADGSGDLFAAELENASGSLVELDADGNGHLATDEMTPDLSGFPGPFGGGSGGGGGPRGRRGPGPGAMLRHSPCHGWGAGPTAWLSKHVLGFRPLAPGCTKLLVDPHLGDLQKAAGSFPTPQGVVQVSHSRDSNGSIQTKIDAPKRIEIVRA